MIFKVVPKRLPVEAGHALPEGSGAGATAGSRRGLAAYTIVELLVAVALLVILFDALYAGISSGFALGQVSRENLRATQIMVERMEGVRLYNWNQLVYSNWIPTTFTSYYYPLTNVGESPGTVFTGTMTVTNAGLPATSYSSSMRAVTVTVNWTSGKVPRTRTLTTYAAQNGMQNYVYNQ